MKTIYLPLLLIGGGVLAGCKPVTIVQPTVVEVSGHNVTPDCVDKVTAHFSSQYAPGSFHANLTIPAPTDITALFAPAPLANGNSSVNIIAPDSIWVTNTGVHSGVVLNRNGNEYIFKVMGNCIGDTFYCVREDSLVFSLNSFVLDKGVNVTLPSAKNPQASGTFIGNLTATAMPTKAIVIELKPSNDAIKIDEKLPGEAKSLTIFPKVGFIPYRITGVHAGNFELKLNAPTGCLSSSYFGTVS